MKTTRRTFLTHAASLGAAGALGVTPFRSVRAQGKKLRIGVGPLLPTADDTKKAYTPVFAHAIALFGADRVLLHPDCGFATFADNPVSSALVAEAKLASIATAVAALRDRYPIVA